MADAALTHETTDQRPSFMTELGLLPPYELSDIKAAYHNKAKAAHPDRGGDPADFMRLKDAYDHAIEYANYHGSRRSWIAAKVEPYLQQEEVIAEVERRGGRVEIERIAWIEKVCGDGFTHLAERLRNVYVRNLVDGDQFLSFLVDHQPAYLMGLDIANCSITGEGLRRIAKLDVLRWINLSGNKFDSRALFSLLRALPSLEWLNVRATRLGWLGRWQLRRRFPQIRIVTDKSPEVTPGSEIMDSLYGGIHNWYLGDDV